MLSLLALTLLSVCVAGAAGAGEGDPCRARGVELGSELRCASGLECVRGDKKSKFGVCVCKAAYPVCGTDGVTYRSGCELRAAREKAQSRDSIQVQHKGRCAQAPVVVTHPGEVWNVTGSKVFLNCEVVGVPTPVLTWRKVSDSARAKAPLLPGDRENMAIQTRGGPEKHTVTGWVLISPLTKQDAGTYECHAANTKGEVSATGSIHVVDSLEAIPMKVSTEEEL